ncbi:MAG: undecaprenyldiphospho-muramoylpentapeptide beta-N-acetylglucosaminyltransferase [Candidatus Fervidibacter sp.]|uniref:undecaprenyldiphospho-muramoylpentapeptide beta-N-acetylglucosaminyltransferase n=3 Tax=Candidatus Fervidibacter sp. TaxID=3100871 RepID=UPI00404B37BE
MVWVMAGGGTGGHIYPALALAAAVKSTLPNAKIWFVGATYGLEQKIVPQNGYPLLTVTARPFPRRLFSPLSLLSSSATIYGVVQAFRHLKKLRPQVVIGTGGYASVCALLAGKLVGARLILFEANSIPGRTNKLLARLANWVATGFPEALGFFPKGKTNHTGVPIRPDIRDMDKATARKIMGLTENERCLLVFGGSRGAQRINEALWDSLPRLLLLPSLKVVHLCGSQWEKDATQIQEALPQDVRERYCPFGYREDMPVLLHAADIAVSRAGASSIAELLTAGVPSILVPYPFAIYDHQRFNALSVVRRGAALMILNSELTSKRLVETVSELLSNPERLERMREATLSIARPFAAEEIVNKALELLG